MCKPHLPTCRVSASEAKAFFQRSNLRKHQLGQVLCLQPAAHVSVQPHHTQLWTLIQARSGTPDGTSLGPEQFADFMQLVGVVQVRRPICQQQHNMCC